MLTHVSIREQRAQGSRITNTAYPITYLLFNSAHISLEIFKYCQKQSKTQS